ncbi:MAG: glutathione ABC transporter substrate-binding protein [Alphaproteobacteria bacterium]|nr:glutathione ABC transporter substrate-binding protein [Alphaproteobacteria bacterium]
MLTGAAAATAGLAAGTREGAAQARGATIRWVEGADVDTLDPQLQRSRPSQIITEHVFGQLLRWKDIALSGFEADLAESWELAPDGVRWTFKLRRGVKFHDGSPLDAEAVKFTLDRIRDPQTGSPNRSQYNGIKAVTAVDAHTVVIETDAPMPTLLEVLATSNSAILSPEAVRKHGRAMGRNPVGTGPFRFKEWIPNERVVIERNPDFYGKKPAMETFVYRPVPEGGARVIEVESGNADIATGVPPEAAERLRSNPRVRLEVLPSSFQIFFELNHARPPFNDVRVRKAVNHAIDREAIVKNILGGFGSVPDGLFPEGTQGRIALKPFAYDPALAKKLMAEAFPGGYREKIVLWTSNGRYLKDRAVAEAVQGYLQEIGLEAEFRVWEWAAYQRELYRAVQGGTGRGSNAAHMWLLGTSIPNAHWRLQRKAVTGDPSNLTGYSNKRVDELMTRAATNMDYEDRMNQYREIQRIFWEEDAGWLFLFNQSQILALNPAVKGLQMFGYEVPILDNVTK